MLISIWAVAVLREAYKEFLIIYISNCGPWGYTWKLQITYGKSAVTKYASVKRHDLW